MLPILFHKLLQKADKFRVGNFGPSTAQAVSILGCNKQNRGAGPQERREANVKTWSECVPSKEIEC